MNSPTEWTTEFFVASDDSSPVEEFLDGLDMKTRARFRWSMEQLRVRNVQAKEPLVRHLEGELWELNQFQDETTATGGNRYAIPACRCGFILELI